MKITLIIMLLGLFTVLVIQNTEVIDVQFFAYEIDDQPWLHRW